jgi:hypothetical protein
MTISANQTSSANLLIGNTLLSDLDLFTIQNINNLIF